jgi:hypothetical protein
VKSTGCQSVVEWGKGPLFSISSNSRERLQGFALVIENHEIGKNIGMKDHRYVSSLCRARKMRIFTAPPPQPAAPRRKVKLGAAIRGEEESAARHHHLA